MIYSASLEEDIMGQTFLTLLLTIFLASSIEPVHLITTLSSDSQLFTQGFTVDDQGKLLLGSGQYGQSKLGYLDPETSQLDTKITLPRQYFGEGVTDTPYGIWQLTWKEGKAFLWNPDNFELIRSFDYPGEGWGITYDAEFDTLWMSDGSSKLYQRDPQTFALLTEIEVKDQGQAINMLNELEFANGLIYANIWYSNSIIAINPETGQVEKSYDLTLVLKEADISEKERQKMDVLNGIAHVEGNIFYLTGKNYPVIFKVELN